MFIYFLIAYIAVCAAFSLLAFAAYGLDKRRARKDKPRISEARLQLLALCGGWPGAWAGQRYFRHKTQKFTFLLVFWMIVVLHVAVVATVSALLLRN